jgi:hypothetical protein
MSKGDGVMMDPHDTGMYLLLDGKKVWLDELCDECAGFGHLGENPLIEGEKCEVCGGFGVVPTDNGLTIIHFMDRWIDRLEDMRLKDYGDLPNHES